MSCRCQNRWLGLGVIALWTGVALGQAPSASAVPPGATAAPGVFPLIDQAQPLPDEPDVNPAVLTSFQQGSRFEEDIAPPLPTEPVRKPRPKPAAPATPSAPVPPTARPTAPPQPAKPATLPPAAESAPLPPPGRPGEAIVPPANKPGEALATPPAPLPTPPPAPPPTPPSAPPPAAAAPTILAPAPAPVLLAPAALPPSYGSPCPGFPCGPYNASGPGLPPCSVENSLDQQRSCSPRAHGIVLGDWLDQGISVNGQTSPDHYNGPVGFNDRDTDYQMNQLDLFVCKDVDMDADLDVGGRIDVLYGTDARYLKALGLETDWQQKGFYQLALPQFYLEGAADGWKARAGRFYAPLGYESAPAPANFFYSHSYAYLYGEPKTLTGVQVTTAPLVEGLTFNGGIDQGDDIFRSVGTHDYANVLAGARWRGPQERLGLDFEINAGSQQTGNTGFVSSLVGTVQATDRLKYVIEHNYGQSTGANPVLASGTPVPTATWYGIDQYLLYDVACDWAAGLRFEWFRDKNGQRVQSLGVGNPDDSGGFQGNFYELTAGLNWRPHKNVLVRPELRWDWFNPDNAAVPRPFGGGSSNAQLLAALDLILTY